LQNSKGEDLENGNRRGRNGAESEERGESKGKPELEGKKKGGSVLKETALVLSTGDRTNFDQVGGGRGAQTSQKRDQQKRKNAGEKK